MKVSYKIRLIQLLCGVPVFRSSAKSWACKKFIFDFIPQLARLSSCRCDVRKNVLVFRFSSSVAVAVATHAVWVAVATHAVWLWAAETWRHSSENKSRWLMCTAKFLFAKCLLKFHFLSCLSCLLKFRFLSCLSCRGTQCRLYPSV